jgi:hypothetical protein
MSTIRVNKVQLNQMGNTFVGVSGSNVSMVAGNVAAVTATTDGDAIIYRGVRLTAANGAVYLITVANNGTLTSTKV